MNRPDYYDEVCVFLGASYFRAVAKGEIYGLSARGLAINTGEAKGEEFPLFKTSGSRSRPRTPRPSSCTRCSTAKAPRGLSLHNTARRHHGIRRGMAIYPRVDLDHAGLAR